MTFLRYNWKEVPIIIYIMDRNITLPAQPEENKKENDVAEERKKRKKKRFSKKRAERKKQKMIAKLTLPKSVFFSQTLIFMGFFLYMIMSANTLNFVFWVITFTIPFYYFEVKKNINEFYNKKMREFNIPYESEKQLEIKEREQEVNNRIQTIMQSKRFDEENFEPIYSYLETAYYLIYYFFASF